MEQNRQSILERLRAAYSVWFDVSDGEGPESLFCQFHSRSEKYVLVKRAQLWAAENNEYVFIYSTPYLGSAEWQRFTEHALAEGQKHVVPHREHMYSYITAIILADDMDLSIIKDVRRIRFTKNYKFSLHGWSTLRVAALDVGKGAVYSNRQGKPVGKFLKKTLRSE